MNNLTFANTSNWTIKDDPPSDSIWGSGSLPTFSVAGNVASLATNHENEGIYQAIGVADKAKLLSFTVDQTAGRLGIHLVGPDGVGANWTRTKVQPSDGEYHSTFDVNDIGLSRLPSIVNCASGEKLLVYHAEARPSAGVPATTLRVIARRYSSGAWGIPSVVSETLSEGYNSYNPRVIRSEAYPTLLYLMWSDMVVGESEANNNWRTWIAFSDDEGLTWEGKTQVLEDKLPSGYFLHEHGGNIYTAWTEYDTSMEPQSIGILEIPVTGSGQTFANMASCNNYEIMDLAGFKSAFPDWEVGFTQFLEPNITIGTDRVHAWVRSSRQCLLHTYALNSNGYMQVWQGLGESRISNTGIPHTIKQLSDDNWLMLAAFGSDGLRRNGMIAVFDSADLSNCLYVDVVDDGAFGYCDFVENGDGTITVVSEHERNNVSHDPIEWHFFEISEWTSRVPLADLMADDSPIYDATGEGTISRRIPWYAVDDSLLILSATLERDTNVDVSNGALVNDYVASLPSPAMGR